MKKALLALIILATGPVMAIDQASIVRSSFTTTNETSCINPALNISEVIVSSAGLAAANLKLYNSTWTTSGQFANLTAGTIFDWDFKDMQVKGICYTTASNSNSGITILYKK